MTSTANRSESRKRFTVESDGWYYVRDAVTNERIQFLDFVSAMEYAREKNNEIARAA